MNRRMKYRRTIAYGMIWLLLVQLLFGTNAVPVSAGGEGSSVEVKLVEKDGTKLSNGTILYKHTDCQEDRWEISYEVTGALDSTDAVYLSLKTQKDGETTETVILDGATAFSANGDGGEPRTEQTFGTDEQVIVKYDAAGEVKKGTICIKRQESEKAMYTIVLQVNNGGVSPIAQAEKTVRYIDEVNAPVITMDNVTEGLSGSVSEESGEGVWTNQEVGFRVCVEDGEWDLQSVTYELDGQGADIPISQDNKKTVVKEFHINTGADSLQGHKLVVTATNEWNEKTTFTRYILMDQEQPVIGAYTDAQGQTIVAGKVYGNPLSFGTTVTDMLPDSRVTVQFGIKKDGETEVKEIISRRNGEYRKEFTENGTYQVRVIATDEAGNTVTSDAVSFCVDGEKPEIQITSAQCEDGCYSQKQTLQYSVEDSNLNGGEVTLCVTRTLDGTKETYEKKQTELVNGSNPFSYDCEKDGYYEIVIKAKDAAGNYAEKKLHFIVDTTAPEVFIRAKDCANGNTENGFMTKEQAKVTIQVKDRNQNVEQYRVITKRLKPDGTWEQSEQTVPALQWTLPSHDIKKQNQVTSSVNLDYTEEGYYEVNVVGQDKAGHALTTQPGSSATATFYIDRTKPVIDNIRYCTNQVPITARYGIIFSNKAIQVVFSVKDAVTGLREQMPVFVTIGTKTDRGNTTRLYPATSLNGTGDYYVILPLEEVDYFDNCITIWADDKLDNEQAVESKRTIYNTNSSVVSMRCTTENENKWTNRDVTYETTVTDVYCGIRKITYKKLEEVNGRTEETLVHEVDFDEMYRRGDVTDLVTTYRYDFTASETAKTVDGYVLQVEVTNNCGTVSTLQKTVYVDKEAPKVELTGVLEGVHYNTNQTIHTKVSDVSYRETTTKYYITCKYDGLVVLISQDEFRSRDYVDYSDVVLSKQGNYEIYAVTRDGAGNETRSGKLSFTIDKEAPVVESVRVLQGNLLEERTADTEGIYYLNADGRLEVRVSEHFPTGDAFACVTGKMGGDEVQKETYLLTESPREFITATPYSREGSYAVSLTGRDKAGNEIMEVTKTIVVDKTRPELSISGIASGKMTREPVTITYQVTDKNHAFENYCVKVERTTLDGTEEIILEQNGADWTQTGYDPKAQQEYCTQKTSVYTKEGNYTITLEGTDKAGNAGVVQTIRFSIDKTAPVISDITYSDVSGVLLPKYNTIFSNKVIQVQFRVTDSVVGVDDSLVYATLGEAKDRGEDTPLYIAKKGIGDYYYLYVPSDLALTEYDGVLTLWANDCLRNETNAQTLRFVQNTDKPFITMDCDLDYTKWHNKDVTFHTKVGDVKSGLQKVSYYIDGKQVKEVVFTEPVTEYAYDLTAKKTADTVSGYKVEVQVTNNNGTTDTAQRYVYIDKEKPAVQLSGIENGSYANTSRTLITHMEDVSYKNTITQYYITRVLDGKTYTEHINAVTLGKYERDVRTTIRKEGRYQIYAVTTDSAGNRTKSNTLRFVIDKTAPKLAISGIRNGSVNGKDVSLKFELTDSFYTSTQSVITIEKTLDGKTEKTQITDFPKTGKHSVRNYDFREDGTYRITFVAVDKAGNRSKTEQISFTIDKTKPKIEITGTTNYQQWDKPVTVTFAVEESYYSGNRVSIRGERQDINGNVEEVELPSFLSNAKKSSLIQTFREDGIYDFEITTKDEAGNEEKKEIHFVLDQNAPEIHHVSEYQGGYYQEFKIADTLEEIFKDLTVVSYRILLNGIEYDGTTPVTEEGKYNLSVVVTDELGHENTENAEFIIDHTAPKVIFTGVKDKQTVSESGTVTLSLTNPEDEIIGVTMNGTEYGADTRQLDYSEYGVYKIDVECVDKAGNRIVRSIQFIYHNPLTTMFVLAIMGGLIVVTCIWLWVRSIRKEKEEGRI